MNNTKLRKQFEEWAAPLRATPPPPLATIQRRARLRIGRIGAAAASAAAVIALAAVLTVTSLGGTARPLGPGPWGSGTHPAPPDQPYVYVSFSLGPTAQIRNAATGAVLATLRPPAPTTTFGVAAAAPTDRQFVVAENPANGTVTFAIIRIVTAGRGGTPSIRMVQVPHALLPAGSQVNDMVVNPAGTRVALEAQAINGNISLIIYNLSNGSLIGRWPVAGLLTSPLAFLPNGNLAVVWAVNGPTSRSTVQVGNPSPVTSVSGQSASPAESTPGQSPSPAESTPGQSPSPAPQFELVNRIINPAVPFRAGSSMNADSQPNMVLHRRIGTLTADGNMSISPALEGNQSAQVSPGGSVGSQGSATATITEYSSANGAPVYVIPIGAASALTGPHYCGVLWASADGRDLLTQCGTRQEEVVDGKVTVVRLAWIFPTSAVQSVSPFAW